TNDCNSADSRGDHGQLEATELRCLVDLGGQKVHPWQRRGARGRDGRRLRRASGHAGQVHEATPMARPTGTATSGSTKLSCSDERPVLPTLTLDSGVAGTTGSRVAIASRGSRPPRRAPPPLTTTRVSGVDDGCAR